MSSITQECTLTKPGLYAKFKMLVEVPYNETKEGPLVHLVRTSDDTQALCSIDITQAEWAPYGVPCMVCDALEDHEWENG